MNKVNPAILAAVVSTFIEEIVEEVAREESTVSYGVAVEVQLKVPHKELRLALGVKRVTREVKDAVYTEISKYPYIRTGSSDSFMLLTYVRYVVETSRLTYTHS